MGMLPGPGLGRGELQTVLKTESQNCEEVASKVRI